MATRKRSTPNHAEPERAEQVTPMPFPGESPTVSLALAAGEKYGFHEKARKAAKAGPKRSPSSRKKSATPARKSATTTGRSGTRSKKR